MSFQFAFDFGTRGKLIGDLGGVVDLQVAIQIAGLQVVAFVLLLCVESADAGVEFVGPGLPVELGTGGWGLGAGWFRGDDGVAE